MTSEFGPGSFGKNRLPLPPGLNRIEPVKITVRLPSAQLPSPAKCFADHTGARIAESARNRAVGRGRETTAPADSAVRAPAGGPLRRRLAAAAGLCSLLLLCGCSTFNRDWRKAVSQPQPPASIEGRWEGTWLSDVNGHTGRLRCLLTRRSDERYQARFRATYYRIFRFSYTVPLTLQSHDDGWEISGEANLGKLAGGNYYYEGRVTPAHFRSTYRSQYDHGIFELRRPE